MNLTMIKLNWQERCQQTEKYHVKKVKANSDWTIRDTAKELNRSYGSVNEDLQLAVSLRIYPRLEVMRRISDALDFIREKKEFIRTRER